ncbi:glucose-6-phosphate isomerase [Flavobacterium columnare]|uniref:Glucose-6-phosphate isomerase n=2 Tax=Flavobacterium columnare TaxID=996 RepID=G8X4Y9_FLACA|nr:glucose-6-phosphate isomerase [Flavobacterium columnare]AEW86805.1 glucose-6-phosphate isomerase [Flavobacterium columnare ATCC 49512]AMO20710.1 glucose-6-phosphate isomerase [Flavobacterium columnare]ANO47227.1 glucose-6-phosphate isomerase [Flavobacterium columnare]APT22101.1 glucose-6-phosphate isomerase [Flavobacterium columnare]AUX18692.1 glucose-6-phosphate isomerase [Flavobacterium columnare]
MTFPSVNPTKTNAWNKLKEHFIDVKGISMQEMFKNDNQRAERFHIEWDHFLLDYSKNRINDTTLSLLLELAQECSLKDAIDSQFLGEKINKTENRAVLHTALRSPKTDQLYLDNQDVIQDVWAIKGKIKQFSQEIIFGERKGYNGKPFTDIVNIGIGGSDLGPAMVTEALSYYKNHLNLHFISNIDGDHSAEILNNLNPETTLFIIVSKTFTTQETLSNALVAKKWFLENAEEKFIRNHFVAVSSEIKKTVEFGIDPDAIFPIWDWVGGRFSLWGAVGLSIALAIGYDQYDQLLSGAYKMDLHFKNAPFNENIPVIMGLLSIWYNNFFDAETEAIIPYAQYLQKLTPYLQQGIMESNGKNISRLGVPVNYQTGTIIWGEPGTNSQHAFFQLIHQGTKIIPTDFIGFKKSLHGNVEHHQKLMANFFAQTEALLNGKNEEQILKEFAKNNVDQSRQQELLPYKVFEGNKPTNTLLIDQLTPETLGSLIALYEHKIFVQGIIWNIFSYDQWGVELGKELANKILEEFNTNDFGCHDSSTSFLLNKFVKQ